MSSTQPDPSAEFIKKIENDIQLSGFPLELHIFNVCSTKNTGRIPSIRYEYLGELREIDLLAFFETIEHKRRGSYIQQHTCTDLIIECKKSQDKPWVFFSVPAYEHGDVTPFLKYFSDFDSYFPSKHLPSLLAQIFPKIGGDHYAAPDVPRCISYYEAFRGTSGSSEIYRAVDSVITYLNYRRQTRAQGRENVTNFSEFHLPVIVLDGYLFEASTSQAGIVVRVRPHLQLRTYHREQIYVIDIVTRAHFEHFFSQVERFHEEIVSAIRSIRFPSDVRAAIKARLKAFSDSPPSYVTDLMLMTLPAPEPTKTLGKLKGSKSRQKREF